MKIPELGVGAVYWPQLDPILDDGSIQVLEIEPQSYWFKTRELERPYRVDQQALERIGSICCPKIIHGVGFPVGGTLCPDPLHLPPLLEVRDALQAPWVSEHLSFNRVAGPKGFFNTGFFLPPLQSEKGVAAAVASIQYMQRQLPVPFAFETAVNYLKPMNGEMSDGAFVAAIAEQADCGILLDLHNIWANELNGRQTAREFLAQIPLDRVWEVHLAGGFEKNGFWLDAHSGEIPQPVLDLAREIVPMLPDLGALIFEMLPIFIPLSGLDMVKSQLEIMHGFWEQRRVRRGDAIHLPRQQPELYPQATVSPQEWEYSLGALTLGWNPGTKFADELAEDRGVALLQMLAGEFRAAMVIDALKLTSRLILLEAGESGFRELLQDFWKQNPPELLESAEAEAFAAYLKERWLGIAYLDEVLDFELAVIRSLISRQNSVVRFTHDPLPIFNALRAGRFPRDVRPGNYEVEVTV